MNRHREINRSIQLKRISEGLCAYCGRNSLYSKRACEDCLEKRKESDRKRKRCVEWNPGKPGRPPTGF